MSVTCQVEKWEQVKAEASLLWDLHYQEVGQDKSRMKLDPDIERCDQLSKLGRLHIVTVRDGLKLVGYHASLINPLLHYRSIIAAIGDLYWIHPAYRVGGIPVRLFKEVERSAKEKGAVVLYDVDKIFAPHGKFFDFLGYKPVETRRSKWIGD